MIPSKRTAAPTRLLASLCVSSLVLIGACGDEAGLDLETPLSQPKGLGLWDLADPMEDGEWQRIEYIEKRTTTDFRGLGQHLQYWPAFGLSAPKKGQRTDGPGTIEYTPMFSNFTHHVYGTRRTFSPDAGGNPLGVKTAGGFYDWDLFTLPNGRRSISGSFYDPYTNGNSNNSVNKIKINRSNLSAFCLNLITDNTNGCYDPKGNIEAQSDQCEVRVPTGDLAFDSNTDMYTFKYTGMEENQRIQIKLKAAHTSTCKGGGLGGIMVSHISTCCTPECTAENECGGDNRCGSPCPCTKGERHANLSPNKTYYIRNIYTRAVLSAIPSTLVEVTRRMEKPHQQWRFEGSCGSGGKCKGTFKNQSTGTCLRKEKSSGFDTRVFVGSCSGDKAKWVMNVRGKDEVIGGRPFSGVNKYSMRHEPSSNNFLFAKQRDIALKVASRSNPNRPPDHWIFELAP